MSSFIIRDGLSPRVAQLNMLHALYRRFNAVWPKSGGTYNKKFEYYHQDSGLIPKTKEFRKFLNIMGMKYADLEVPNYEENEIESAWFSISIPATVCGSNHEDASDGCDDLTPLQAYNEMVDQDAGEIVDDRIFEEDEISITFYYGGELKKVLGGDGQNDTHIDGTTYTNDRFELLNGFRDEIMLDPGKYVISQKKLMNANQQDSALYLSDLKVVDYSYDQTVTGDDDEDYQLRYAKPVVFITTTAKYGWYALFDDGTVFEKLVTTNAEVTQNAKVTTHNQTGFKFTVKYRAKKDLVSTDQCMISFIKMFNDRKVLVRTSGALPIRITQQDYVHQYPTNDPVLWPGGRLSIQKASELKRGEFAKMMSGMIDTDFKVRDAEAWEVAAAIVIAIIAVIIFALVIIFCVACGVAATPGLATLAAAFGAASLALSIGSMILAYYGGASAAYLVKTIGKVAQYTGIMSSVLGIFAFIQGFVAEVSKQAAAEIAKETAKGVVMSAVDTAMIYLKAALSVAYEAIKSAASQMLSFAEKSVVQAAEMVSSWIDQIFQVYKYYDENYGEIHDAMKEAEALQKETKELEDMNEANAPHMQDVMHDMFTYSLGSYDALAELDLKMRKATGGWREERDPATKLT